jgi:hypothetical protein
MPDTNHDNSDLIRQIRPNKLVDLIYDVDFFSDAIDVRRSVIYDVTDDRRVVVAQTDPPILKSAVGRTIEVTFMYTVPGQQSTHRFGYQAKITEYVTQYQLRSETSEPALMLTYPSVFKESGLRMHYRLEPTISFEVRFCLAEQKDLDLPIIDISLGGARLNLPGHLQVQRHQKLHLKLHLAGAMYRVSARVQRIIVGEHSGFHQVGVQFLDLDDQCKQQLNLMIQAHARQQLRQRAGLSSTPGGT